MKIEAALFSRVTTYAGFAALCGTRVYPIVLPQNPTLPAVTFQRISAVREQIFGGSAGLAHPRFQFTVWASTYASSRDVAEQLRLALDGYYGLMGGAGGVQADATLVGEQEFFDPETGWYQTMMDFEVWHQE